MRYSSLRAHRSLVRGALLLPLTACAQTLAGVSPSTVLSTVIMAGEAIGVHSGGTSTTSSAGTTVRIPRSPAPTAPVSRMLETASQYIGVRYTWGGSTPESGFDCSGFTKYVFAKQGVSLPRTSREQAHVAQPVPVDLAALAPGDLLFFAEPGEAISHVAIYVGDGRIIQSSEGLGGVNYLDLQGNRGGWYLQNMVAVRRVTERS